MFISPEPWVQNLHTRERAWPSPLWQPCIWPCDSVLALPFAVNSFNVMTIFYVGKKWGAEWCQFMVLAVKVKCMWWVQSKFFILRWQFYRKTASLKGVHTFQDSREWLLCVQDAELLPCGWVSWNCQHHREVVSCRLQWTLLCLAAWHTSFFGNSPSVFLLGSTLPHCNTSLTIIFSLLAWWLFRAVMQEWKTIGAISMQNRRLWVVPPFSMALILGSTCPVFPFILRAISQPSNRFHFPLF